MRRALLERAESGSPRGTPPGGGTGSRARPVGRAWRWRSRAGRDPPGVRECDFELDAGLPDPSQSRHEILVLRVGRRSSRRAAA